MQPRRPDSAKSRVTQKTLDTELNQSKFSQTFTSYTTLNLQKKDEFLKYLEQKEKDPKFKKFNQPSLPQIPQKPTRQQLAKINSKPFQKRNSKITSKPKIQQAPKQITTNTKQNPQPSAGNKWTVNHPPQNVNGTKKENKLQGNTSQSFAEKNKQKMNLITAGLKKIQNEQKKAQKKIEFKGFKVNAVGKKQASNNKVNQEQKQAQNEFMTTNLGSATGVKPNQSSPSRPQTSNGVKKQTKAKEKTEEQIKRQQQLLQISRFINQVQMKNIDYYPEGYQEFVQRNQSQLPEDLYKININDFLIEPTERDYQKMQRKIKNNQKQLDQQNLSQSRVSSTSSSQNQSSNQTSIDLDKIIDGDSESQASRQNQQQENQIFLSSISSKDLKERNLFLTEVLKGRVTKQDISKLQQMDKSQIKLKKLQEPIKEDDDVEIMQINMMKKKSNRIFQRNIVQASGQIYRDCDYLSEQNKLRLQRLLNGEMDPSPFEASEWQRFAMRRIDEGIRLYRELSNSSNDMSQQVIPEELLPKDPNLRKQAERKILKQKIDSINSRLHQIENIVVNQAKIQSLIEQHRTSRISQSTQALIDERHKQMSELEVKSRQASQMIAKAQRQKGQIESALKQMQASYKNFQQQCKAYQKLSLEELANRERQEIRQKKRKIQEISKSFEEIQQGTEQTIEKFHHQMEHQISILKQIQNLATNNPVVYLGLELDLNQQNLNAKFQTRASEDPQLIEIRNKLFSQEEKENEQIS